MWHYVAVARYSPTNYKKKLPSSHPTSIRVPLLSSTSMTMTLLEQNENHPRAYFHTSFSYAHIPNPLHFPFLSILILYIIFHISSIYSYYPLHSSIIFFPSSTPTLSFTLQFISSIIFIHSIQYENIINHTDLSMNFFTLTQSYEI